MSLKSENRAEYNTWRSMIARCSNEDHPRYKYYGQRGITVCQRWMSFEVFLGDMGTRPEGTTSIDRINNNDGYHPKNCRWADQKTQVQNSARCILTDDEVEEIRYIGKIGNLTHEQIAAQFGVARSTITNILLGNKRAR